MAACAPASPPNTISSLPVHRFAALQGISLSNIVSGLEPITVLIIGMVTVLVGTSSRPPSTPITSSSSPSCPTSSTASHVSSSSASARSATGDISDNQLTCSICLEEFQDDDEVKLLPCSHLFHANEIDHWLSISGTDTPANTFYQHVLLMNLGRSLSHL